MAAQPCYRSLANTDPYPLVVFEGHLDVLDPAKQAVTNPVPVTLSPYFAAMEEIANLDPDIRARASKTMNSPVPLSSPPRGWESADHRNRTEGEQHELTG